MTESDPMPLALSSSRCRCTWLALVVALAATSFAFGQGDGGQTDGPGPPPASGPAVTLFDVGAEAAARLGAATALLESGSVADLERAIRDDEAGGPRLFVLQAIAAAPAAPPLLEQALLSVAESADPATLADLARSLRHYQSQAAVRTLIAITEPSRPPEAREAAFASLRRITGLTLGNDRGEWAAWFAQVEFLSPVEWHARLAEQLRRSAARLEADRTALRASLVGLYRRLYVATPHAERGPLLAELLSSPDDEVRGLGFELTNREIQSARTPNGEVVKAVRGLLVHPSASVRERAARLLNPLAPADGGVLIASALAKETDAAAAAAMLTAVAQRWPTPVALESVLRWLDAPSAAREAAVVAAAALHAAGHLKDEADATRVLAAMREIGPDRLPPPGIALLATIGAPEDRERIARLLQAEQESLRKSAADALKPFPEYVDDLLAAASRDASLLPQAVEALVAHRPTIDGFEGLLALPESAARADALLRVAEVIDLPHLLAACERVGDSAFRERALERIEPIEPTQPLDELLVRGLRMLALARLDLGRPERALSTIERLLVVSPESEVKALRTRALVALGRIDEAREAEGMLEDWLSGLADARKAGQAHVPAIAAAILESFGEALTAEQRAVVESCLPKPEEAPAEPPPAGEESPPPGEPPP